jgi:RNA polymerase sigma-70 factor (family 1)
MFPGEEENRVEDQLLLLKLKEGSELAFDALYEKYWQGLYAAAFKRLEDPDQAKDITQDVFLQLWLKRNEAHIENLPAYLYTAVKNKVFNWLEKESKYTPVSDLLLLLETSHDLADARLLKTEFIQIYEALINTLTLSQQKIFRLRYHEELSTIEIAAKLDISRKTVQNQLGKAVAQLRASLVAIAVLLVINNF